jgi:hypothetical protein
MLATTSPTEAQSRGNTPKREARRGTKGTTTRLATPATAVLAPIQPPDSPMRSISRESSGIVRLKPTPTAAARETAAVSEAFCSDVKPVSFAISP